MRVFRYLLGFLGSVAAFFYRLLRDWWLGQWGKLRPGVVNLVGWGVFVLLIVGALALNSPTINSVVLAIGTLIGVIWFTLNMLPRARKKQKKRP